MGSPPDAMLAAVLPLVRAIHFAASILLFGQFAFVLLVARGGATPPGFRRVVGWSLAALLASALAWIALEAISMSGLPASEALSAATLGAVATQTQFGRVSLARMLACLALVALAARPRQSRSILGAALSAFVLAALAGMGHGGDGRGFAGWAHLAIDATHLLAAGAWLGSLVPLVFLLRAKNDDIRKAAQVTQRFSTLGVWSVAVILGSGIANTCFMLSHAGALFDSAYGELLLVKVALFAAIVAFAAVNRQRLSPRLREGDANARHALGRNAVVECVLGFAIVAIVGQLGITVPAAHHMG